MNRLRRTLPMIGFAALTACGLWVQTPKKPGGTTTNEQPTSTPLVSTPEAAVSLIETATKSAGSGMKALSSGGATLSLLADGQTIQGCAASNEPVSSDATKNVAKDQYGVMVLPDSDPAYALGKFYCMIAANSGDEGSVLGAFDLPKLVTCLAGGNVQYDGVEHTSEVVVANSQCFGPRTPDGLSPSVTVKSTAIKPAVGAGAGWDSTIDLNVFDGDKQLAGIKMFMKATDTQVAVAFQGGGTATDAYAFNLDIKEGALRYEGKFLRIPDSDFSNHIRLLIKGTVDKAGNFSAVNGLEGARSAVYNSAGTSKIQAGVLITIKGDSTNGYRTYDFKCSGNPGDCDGQDPSIFHPVTGTGVCGAAASGYDCAGNDGIQLSEAADMSFLMRPAEPGFEPASIWISALSPLVYDHVVLTQTEE